jgi:GMP synthase (glutamine-hydrolysing)
MSVNDEDESPWLIDETECVRNMVQNRLQVLGICLGAPMIASASGAAVFPSVKERGWSDGTWFGRVTGILLSGAHRVFQWHGETFNLTGGATLLCTGERVRNQASLCRAALGVQLQSGVTHGMIERWTSGLKPRCVNQSKQSRALHSRRTGRSVVPCLNHFAPGDIVGT